MDRSRWIWNACVAVGVLQFLSVEGGPDAAAVQNLTAYSQGPDWISIRWITPDKPHVDTYILKYKEMPSGKPTPYKKIEKTNECILWSQMTCFTLYHLSANKTYSLTIAPDGAKRKQEATVSAFTAESACSRPLDLRALNISPHEVILSWTHPWLPHGKLLRFNVKVEINKSYLRYTSWKSLHRNFSIENGQKNYTFNFTALEPSTFYKVQVNGQSTKDGEFSSITIVTPTVEPMFVNNVSVVKNGIDIRAITITLPSAALYLTQNSAAFIVVSLLDGHMPDFEDKSVFYNPVHRNEILKEVKTDVDKKKWIAAEIQLSEKQEEFVVGQTKNSSLMSTKYGKNFVNQPLAPACQYQISIVAFNEHDSKLFSSYTSLVKPVQTRGSPLPLPNGNLDLLALLLLLLCYCVIIIHHKYIMYKKEKRPLDNDEILHTSESKPGGNLYCENKMGLLRVKVLCNPPVPLHKTDPDNNIKEAQVQPAKPLTHQGSSRVQISKLEQYVRSSIASGELQRQHALFPKGNTQQCECGQFPENKAKNRYATFPAYDATRVVLQKYNNDEFSNYINANYIECYKAPKFYIATQGPKANTIADFWRMIWQEKVQVISMLTNTVESGKKKCEVYWPETSNEVTYAGINIQTTSAEVIADYTVRQFILTYKEKKRNVQHFHFTNWPKHEVLLYPQSVATYLRKLNASSKGSGPILVHCSSGFGRTGTIILADINLRMAAAEGAVDVLYYLRRIREQRCNLVRDVDEYKLVHLILLECLVEEQSDIPCDENFETYVQDLKNRGGIDRQFLRLNKHKWFKSQAGTQTPSEIAQAAHHKNRNQDIVPGLLGQIRLSPVTSGDPTSTYINAVSVDGFRTKNQFITTQFPLSGTVGDFWRLIYEKKITLIVVLNEVNTSDKAIVEFRPKKDSPLQTSPFMEVRENHVDKYKHWNLHYLQITETSSKCQSRQESVRLLQYKGWYSSQNVPSSTKNLLSLWEEAEQVYTGKGPVLVTCLDGAKACGLFVALVFLVEKVKLQHICNVCQAVRTVRQPRNQFIATQEQFEFLYSAMMAYLEDFQTYTTILQ